MNDIVKSQNFSPFGDPSHIRIELFIRNGVCIVSAYWMNDLPKLIFIVAILQLLIDKLQIGNVELPFSLEVQKTEMSLSAFFWERISLS